MPRCKFRFLTICRATLCLSCSCDLKHGLFSVLPQQLLLKWRHTLLSAQVRPSWHRDHDLWLGHTSHLLRIYVQGVPVFPASLARPDLVCFFGSLVCLNAPESAWLQKHLGAGFEFYYGWLLLHTCSLTPLVLYGRVVCARVSSLDLCYCWFYLRRRRSDLRNKVAGEALPWKVRQLRQLAQHISRVLCAGCSDFLVGQYPHFSRAPALLMSSVKRILDFY